MAADTAATVATQPAPAGRGLRLHFSPGACSRVTLVALEEAGAEYSTVRVSLKDGEHRHEAFRALNPKGKVPVLETAQGVLTENVAILVHVANSHAHAGLLPDQDTWARDQALSALAWFASTVHPLLTMSRYPERFCDLPEAAARMRKLVGAQLHGQMLTAESALTHGTWMLGPQWSLADAYLHWTWGRCQEAGLAASNFPHVAAHHACMQDRPAVLRALAREQTALPR
jgi:glutathione S-transferase